MSIAAGQYGRPLSKEEKCSLYSVSTEDYFRCLKSSNVQLFSPGQQLKWWGWIILIILIAFGSYYVGPLFFSFMSGQKVRF
jgi:hypothetical protein